MSPEKYAGSRRYTSRNRRHLERLLSEGHLRLVDGALEPSAAAAAMLGEYPDKAFAISRAVIGEEGPKTQALTVSRVGGRTLVFRIRQPAGEPALFEWAEVDRVQLRTLVTALLMTEEQFRLSTMGATDAETVTSAVSEQAAPARTINFCPACGSRVGEGFRFCAGCGTELPTA
jgi:NADH pyrophosphatase NudC (nudix superfamily)